MSRRQPKRKPAPRGTHPPRRSRAKVHADQGWETLASEPTPRKNDTPKPVPPQPHALTARQTLFVAAYGKSANATQAAVAAGFAPKSAATAGYRLLRNVYVAQAITAQLVAQTKRIEADTDELKQELEWIALSRIGRIVTPEGSLIALTDLPVAVQAAIASVEVKRESQTSRTSEDGEESTTETVDVHKVKLWDKLSAINTLLKLRGLLDRNINLKGKIEVDVVAQAKAQARAMTTPQLAAIVRHLDAIDAIEAGDISQ